MHVYEVRSRKDKSGVDLISDALPFGRLWHDTLWLRLSPSGPLARLWREGGEKEKVKSER